ncbi:hypothetical protein Ddye_009663 [Dipteronia dyeriana]|uniref:hAT-like transposase RNase-H fold domain-containing protein n=1 Tax=Dipteronia dyeriana TaxID=168575 RepID=A0AAD9XBS4_9ROSI|nr:hypothetical protein Ddye_009663 [Dipteronia dyeriana]
MDDETLPSNIIVKRERSKKGPSNVWLLFTKYGDDTRCHKGETIGKIIESCLLDWGIEKVFTITVDNASTNKVAIDYVKRRMRNWNESKLVLDVLTRWNSTYLMLSTALKFQKAFDRLLEDNGRYGLYFSELDSGKKRVGLPKDDDWELCSIANELSTLAGSGDFLLYEMMVAMKSKFDKYWGKIEDVNKLLIIAFVFYPRYKLDYVKFCFGDLFDENKVNEMTYDFKELLIKLYEFYNGVDNISSSDQVSKSIPLENEGDMGKVNENVDFRLERLKKFKKNEREEIFLLI